MKEDYQNGLTELWDNMAEEADKNGEFMNEDEFADIAIEDNNVPPTAVIAFLIGRRDLYESDYLIDCIEYIANKY